MYAHVGFKSLEISDSHGSSWLTHEAENEMFRALICPTQKASGPYKQIRHNVFQRSFFAVTLH